MDIWRYIIPNTKTLETVSHLNKEGEEAINQEESSIEDIQLTCFSHLLYIFSYKHVLVNLEALVLML